MRRCLRSDNTGDLPRCIGRDGGRHGMGQGWNRHPWMAWVRDSAGSQADGPVAGSLL